MNANPALRGLTEDRLAASGRERLPLVVADQLLELINVFLPDGTIRLQRGSPLVLGRDPETRIGRSTYDYVHPDDLAGYRSWVARLAAAPPGKGIEDIELRVRHADGGWRRYRVQGTNLLTDPEVQGLLEIARDETERAHAESAAHAANQRLALAAEASGMGFFEFDVAADRVEASPECARMLGFEPQPTVRSRAAFLDEIETGDRADVSAAFERAIAGADEHWDVEFRLKTASGDWRWVNQRGRIVARDGRGRALRIVGVTLDVDRRKRAEHGRADSEARYRSIIAMTPGFVHETELRDDGALQLRWASDGFTRLLGWTPAEMNLRGGWQAIVHPFHEKESIERRARALAGEPVTGELMLLAKSGEWRWFAASAFPLRDATTGRVSSILGMLYDITERKQTEERLRLSEERFRLAAEAVDGVIYERDIATRSITCHSGVEEVLGYRDAMVTQLDWWLARIHPDDIARFLAERLGDDDGGRLTTSSYRVRHARGHYVDVMDRALRIRDRAGTVVRLVGSAIDVSRERRTERLLREAEALAHAGSWEVDVVTGALHWSDETYRIHGLSRGLRRMDVDTALGLYTPDSAVLVRAAHDRALASGQGFDLDLEIVRADGVRRWVRTSGRAEVVDGRTRRLYGAIQDIDDHKRAEVQLREQSDWLRLAMDAAQLLAWTWNPADDRLLVKYRHPAVDDAGVLPATLREALVPVVAEDRAATLNGLRETIETGEPREIDCRAVTRDGRTHSFLTRVIRAKTDGGYVAIGATQDISARRDAEQRLRASEAVLRSVTENSPDVIVVTDTELRVAFANRELQGRSPAALLGRPVTEFLGSEWPDTPALLRRVLSTGQPARFETMTRAVAGEVAVLEWRVAPIEQSGRITGLIAQASEISERRSLEREILEISDREQRRIGSDLHDGLGQELTGISLLLRSLASGVARGSAPTVADLDEIVGLVNGAIDTTRTLARGLSPIALEGGGLVYALRALVARAREIYGLDIHFRSRVAPRVTLDAAATGHLYRIAQESLTNAARHAHASSVAVQLTVRDQRVMLAVTDDGRGLPAGGGSGMGLRIMNYRAHMLGGELVIGAGPDGRGTRVTCTLLQPEPRPAATEN